MTRLLEIPVADYAIRIFQKGLPCDEMLGRVAYIGLMDVASAHSGLIYLSSNVPRMSVDEVVYREGFTKKTKGRWWDLSPGIMH